MESVTRCASNAAPGASGKSGDMERAHGARLIALLTCCLLFTACPSGGGDLLPLREDAGGELESASFKNDTLSVTHNQVTIKARGNWSVSDSETWLTLEIKN